MIRRSIVEKHGIRFPEGVACEDLYFHYVAFPRCRRVCVVSRAAYVYRKRAGSITSGFASGSSLQSLDYLTVAQLVLEGAPRAELEQVIHIIKSVELPLTLADLGLKKFDEAEWRRAAELACAEGETIHNEPFKVTPAMVYDAIVTADRLLQNYKD